MASLFGKILSGVMVAGSSVLSVLAPPVGVPLLATSVGFAANQFGTTDPVTASTNAVATGQNQAVQQATINNNAALATNMTQYQAYTNYVNQGYSTAQASSMSGYQTTPTGTSGNIIKYILIAVAGFVALKVLKIIR